MIRSRTRLWRWSVDMGGCAKVWLRGLYNHQRAQPYTALADHLPNTCAGCKATPQISCTACVQQRRNRSYSLKISGQKKECQSCGYNKKPHKLVELDCGHGWMCKGNPRRAAEAKRFHRPAAYRMQRFATNELHQVCPAQSQEVSHAQA